MVPLRWGAGVKGKVNSAMSHGVPVVCTSIAQEGMHLIDGSDAFVTDDPREFAAKVHTKIFGAGVVSWVARSKRE